MVRWMRLLVTGGAGFIGSNFVNYWLLKYPDDSLINVDKLTYASNPEYVKHHIFGSRYKLVREDITNREVMDDLVKRSDVVVNFAAESHVDNSIASAEPFVRSNYFGVFNILESVRRYDVQFHQVSTDEVYGSLPLDSDRKFTESSAYNPRNPYSATKAAADHLIRSYINTYGIHATISNSSNNFGPYQHREKLIPKTIINAMNNRRIPVYGDGSQMRDWLYVEDHCSAIEKIILSKNYGETYLVSAENERRNIDVVTSILRILGKSKDLIEFVDDRPGHDVRYALDPSKLKRHLSWKAVHSFESALKSTVEHYVNNLNLYM